MFQKDTWIQWSVITISHVWSWQLNVYDLERHQDLVREHKNLNEHDMSKSLFLSHKHFDNGCNWPHCCWTDCRQTAYQEPLRYCGSVPWRLLNWYRNVCLSRVSTYPINTHDENMNDYRCCNIWIVHRSEVSYWRNPMHHWTVHTTKPSTAVILISLPMMISNDHSSCIFINVHTGDHSQLCRKLQWYWPYW